jgi:hypothetical protein
MKERRDDQERGGQGYVGGQATVSMVGIAVIMALMLSMASAALAGTGVGANFNLGKTNTVNRLSQLVGSTDNALLRIDDNNAGTNATALDLRVEPGLTPMKVNSSTQVSNLNAALIDGRSASSFVANSTYRNGQGQERAGKVLGDASSRTRTAKPKTASQAAWRSP